MRAPVDHLAAPLFPLKLRWLNGPPLQMDQLRGRAVLIEFWDFCRANSLRTLPYMKAWHERYEEAGLQVIGVHAGGFDISTDPDVVEAAVERLAIPYSVVIDTQLEIWERYGNVGWPGRYLFNQAGMLYDLHYGEGAYAETEHAIQELLGVDRALLEPLRPEDAPGAVLEPQSEDVAGTFSGPYTAGGVWAVLDGSGTVTANSSVVAVDHPGCYELISHPRSTRGHLQLEVGPGVRCDAVCFTPGLAVGRRAG